MKYINKIIIVLILVVMFFVFGSSLNDYESSHQISNSIAEAIRPMLEDLLGSEQLELEALVRKMAHVVEFSVLGFLVAILLYRLKIKYHQSFGGLSLLVMLLVAVLDEYIQSFFGRSSKVADILLDFFGALLGFSLAFLIMKATKYFRRKRKNKYC